MNEEDVRDQLDPSVQPTPKFRSMAGTELVRRRQKRSNALVQPNFSVVRVVVGVIMVAMVATVFTFWLRWSGYI